MADDLYVEELLSDLQGLTIDQGQMTWLVSELGTDDLSMTVEQGSQIFRGVAEVGEELVYVRSTNGTTGVVTLAPFGRGYMGTEKISHPMNTRVSFSPRFPRARVRKAINETILAVYPQLFAVDYAELTPDWTKTTYTLPADAENILSVRQKVAGTSGFSRVLTNYSLRRGDGTAELNIMQSFNSFEPIRVTYTKRPTKIQPGEEFTDSGLAETAWECIKFGAMFRLISVQEAGRSGAESVEAAEGERRRQHPSTLARQYYAAHQQLLIDERMRLLSEHEITNNQEYV